MADLRVPDGLGVSGAALWAEIATEYVLDATQRVTLVEVCRAKDRLDLLAGVLRDEADERWSVALNQANATANLMKQLVAALRLPDAAGKRPGYKGPRVQKPSMPGGAKVSSLDRARSKSA